MECERNEEKKNNLLDSAPPRRGAGLSVFQDDLKDDVAGVAATVDHLLEQFVKVAQKDDVFGVVIALVKIAQKLELEIIGFAFDVLQFRVHLARGPDVHSFAQLFHHR